MFSLKSLSDCNFILNLRPCEISISSIVVTIKMVYQFEFTQPNSCICIDVRKPVAFNAPVALLLNIVHNIS